MPETLVTPVAFILFVIALLLIIIGLLVGLSIQLYWQHKELIKLLDAYTTRVGEAIDLLKDK